MKSSNELSGPSSQGDKPVPPGRTSRGLSNIAKVALAGEERGGHCSIALEPS